VSSDVEPVALVLDRAGESPDELVPLEDRRGPAVKAVLPRGRQPGGTGADDDERKRVHAATDF
jgi:hypothetical protein